MGGLQAPQAVKHPAAPEKVVPTFVNLENIYENIPIDPYDNIGDITHKAAVNKYVYAQCPAAKEVNLSAKRIDAAVLSAGYDSLIFSIADVTHLPLTKENLDKYRGQIAAWLRPPEKKNGKYDPKELKEYRQKQKQRGIPNGFPAQFRQLEELDRKGIPVFLAAGNGTPLGVDLLNFANGVRSVGAWDKNNHKADYSADNSLVKIWARGNYPIAQIFGKNGNIIGYNITGGQQVEIPLSQTSGRPPSTIKFKSKTTPNSNKDQSTTNTREVMGTSLAAPTAVGRFLRQKYGKGCDLN